MIFQFYLKVQSSSLQFDKTILTLQFRIEMHFYLKNMHWRNSVMIWFMMVLICNHSTSTVILDLFELYEVNTFKNYIFLQTIYALLKCNRFPELMMYIDFILICKKIVCFLPKKRSRRIQRYYSCLEEDFFNCNEWFLTKIKP